ncbi:SRRM2 protein homolog rsr-2-like [Candoia aspera]|uniref:SRRM2 protein homolog rsr-2-like n=1 Tax=Candoia aspera TaxID=51853 RepID=UPI002FD868EE
MDDKKIPQLQTANQSPPEIAPTAGGAAAGRRRKRRPEERRSRAAEFRGEESARDRTQDSKPRRLRSRSPSSGRRWRRCCVQRRRNWAFSFPETEVGKCRRSKDSINEKQQSCSLETTSLISILETGQCRKEVYG